MKKGKTTITGTLLYYDVKNSNDRIYTKECAARIVEQSKEDIEKGNLLGELGFPERFEVSLGHVSHRVCEIHLNEENKSIEGTIEILKGTPKGQYILKLLEESNCKFEDMFVIRSRGTGTVNPKTKEIENYTLYTFDVILKEDDAFKTMTPIFKIE